MAIRRATFAFADSVPPAVSVDPAVRPFLYSPSIPTVRVAFVTLMMLVYPATGKVVGAAMFEPRQKIAIEISSACAMFPAVVTASAVVVADALVPSWSSQDDVAADGTVNTKNVTAFDDPKFAVTVAVLPATSNQENSETLPTGDSNTDPSATVAVFVPSVTDVGAPGSVVVFAVWIAVMTRLLAGITHVESVFAVVTARLV